MTEPPEFGSRAGTVLLLLVCAILIVATLAAAGHVERPIPQPVRSAVG